MKPESELEADYFGLASAWDEELYGKLRQQRKLALIAAGISAAIAAMAVGAVMYLTPLKTVKPYVIMVDKTTGHAEAVRELVRSEANPLTENESVVLGELASYVIARETFDPADAQRRILRLQMSTDRAEFGRFYRNYQSEAAQFNTDTMRTVNIKTVVPNMANKTAAIRFSTTLNNFGNSSTRHWQATLSYDFVDLDIETKYRFINPLGFIVKTYRVDPENIE